MRVCLNVAFFLVVTLALAIPAGAQSFFTANLTSSQEPGGNESVGSGTAALVLNDDGLWFSVTVGDLTGPIAAAHFHMATAGENGGVVRAITADLSGNSGSGLWSSSDDQPLTPELVRALWEGNLYLNVHTAANPGGEIRGQVYPSSGTGFTANLTTTQETHDVAGEATGTASLLLSEGKLLYAVSVTGLSGDISGAHFHGGPIGVGAGVVKAITGDFNGPTAVGIWTPDDDQPLAEELVADLLLGNLYLNVHTAANPAGEIRGQVLMNSGLTFVARLDPDQENPGVVSDGLGTATLALDDSGLLYDITVSGLTGSIAAAHFHNAPSGENGGVVRAVEFTDGHASGIWSRSGDQPLTDALLDELLIGNLYLNVHTGANPGGEIRGQVLLRGGTSFGAGLNALQQPHDVSSSGIGTASLSLTEEGLSFSLTVDSLSGPITGAHFHVGPIGDGGPVVRAITGDFTGNTATGLWTSSDGQPLNEAMLRALMTGNLYLNVHTAANPAGEIRGQVLINGGTSMTASLDAAQEGGGVTSAGSGTASLSVTPAGVVYSLTVDSLSGLIAGAHFHSGDIGTNGGVVKSVTDDFVGNTAIGLWTAADDEPLTADLLQDLVTGGLYFNIHTAAYPGGEIRGQVILNSGVGSAVQLDPGQQTSDVSSEGRGTASLTLNVAGVSFALTHEGLTGDLAAAHFHNAPSGESGGVVRAITDDFGSPTASGLWTAEDTQPLTDELTLAYLRGQIYLNLHTAANPGGEIRGQVLPGRAVVTAVELVSAEIPDQIALYQNYPNPFNPTTRIEFSLDRSTRARLAIYNTLGQVVAVLVDGEMVAGSYAVSFGAVDLPSGIYYARLAAGGQEMTRAMILMK